VTRVFVTQDLEQSCNQQINLIKKDFRHYKATGSLPSYFGRDKPYSRPRSVKDQDMHHLHIADNGNEFGRYTPQYYRTSDNHIIYTRGYADQSDYLIIAFITPNAHEKANDYEFLEQYAFIAHKFRCQY